MTKLTEIIKLLFLKAEANIMMLRCRSEPLLFFYWSDASPTSTKELCTRSFESRTVRRKGRASRALLVQRLFILGSGGECNVVLDEPRAMADKTAWTHTHTHTEAYRYLMPKIRGLRHRSIVVALCVWDRAIQSACARQVPQVNRAAESNGPGVDDFAPPPGHPRQLAVATTLSTRSSGRFSSTPPTPQSSEAS